MLKILYKYYPLAYVILYRETTRKACGVRQWIRSWPKEKRDVSWFPLQLPVHCSVSAHAPGKEPGGPWKYYISVTSSSKHVHEKPVTSHLSHCNTTRLRKLGCQQYISLWGGVTPPAYISAHPAPAEPLQFPARSFVFHCNALCFYTYG